MSVIHTVGDRVVDDFGGINSGDLNTPFIIAEAINDCMCGIPTLESVINNTARGFGELHHRDQTENKKRKYNRWLESALKASTPNSLVSQSAEAS